MNGKQFHEAARKIAGPDRSVSTTLEWWKFSHRDKCDPVSYKISILPGMDGDCSQVESRSMAKSLKLLKQMVEGSISAKIPEGA